MGSPRSASASPHVLSEISEDLPPERRIWKWHLSYVLKSLCPGWFVWNTNCRHIGCITRLARCWCHLGHTVCTPVEYQINPEREVVINVLSPNLCISHWLPVSAHVAPQSLVCDTRCPERLVANAPSAGWLPIQFGPPWQLQSPFHDPAKS